MPASDGTAAAPKVQPLTLTYESICAAARMNVLRDFARERQYWVQRTERKAAGSDVLVISVTEDEMNALVRPNSSRLLKEHSSVSWATFFLQASLFGFIGIFSVGTAITTYGGIYHNRMLLPMAPIGAVCTWQLWKMLENTWRQQRYTDNAARIRQSRKGNPMNAVAQRKKKSPVDRDGEEEDSIPAGDINAL